jgi:hypothetical protein
MKLTALFCTAVTIVLGVYDAYMVTFYGVEASISRYLQNTAIDSPVFSFSIGFICGHVFGYMKPTNERITN